MQDASYWARVADKHTHVLELLDAAEAVWECAAEGGADEVANVAGYKIRRLALAVCALREFPADADEWAFARDWPAEQP